MDGREHHKSWCSVPSKHGLSKLSELKSKSTKSNTYRSNPWHELSIWNVARRRREKEHRLESRGGPVALTNRYVSYVRVCKCTMGWSFFRFFIFIFFRERNSEPKPQRSATGWAKKSANFLFAFVHCKQNNYGSTTSHEAHALLTVQTEILKNSENTVRENHLCSDFVVQLVIRQRKRKRENTPSQTEKSRFSEHGCKANIYILFV